MITVFKYEVSCFESGIELPFGAKILSVSFQRDTLCMWAAVDTEAATEIRNFDVFGTGHNMPKVSGGYKFIGTARMDNGLVFHVFERLGL